MTSRNFEKLIQALMMPTCNARISDYAAWCWIHSESSALSSPNLPCPKVCFTGFTKAEKRDAKALAWLAGFRVVTSVSKGLDFLCVGRTPGPAKLARARNGLTKILDLDGFYQEARKFRKYTLECIPN